MNFQTEISHNVRIANHIIQSHKYLNKSHQRNITTLLIRIGREKLENRLKDVSGTQMINKIINDLLPMDWRNNKN